MIGRGRWLFAAAGTFALVVLLIGALIGGAPGSPPPVSPSPTPTAPIGVPSPPPTPSATPVATNGPVATYRVWFVRDELPPLAGTLMAHAEQNAVDRTIQRVSSLIRAGAQVPPAGSTNPAALIRQRTTVSGGFTVAVIPLSVRIDGDLATAEFDIEDWGVRGAAITEGLVQQLVYTITEEPGITRARIVEKGKTSATIDQLVVDKPLAREDVFGYSFRGTETSSIVSEGDRLATTVVSTKVTNEEIPALGRFTVEIAGGGSAGGRLIPRFTAKLTESAGKWLLRLDLPDAAAPNPKIPYEQFASGPITSVDSPHTRTSADVGAIFTLTLDDARPWRVTVGPTTAGARVNVDVGGRPESVNRNIAVYSVGPGNPGLLVRGAARVFEANVSWRMKDASGQIVARGNTTATIGTSPVWGTFQFTAQGPATGPATLEVYWASPRDGSEQDVVAIPLGVR